MSLLSAVALLSLAFSKRAFVRRGILHNAHDLCRLGYGA